MKYAFVGIIIVAFAGYYCTTSFIEADRTANREIAKQESQRHKHLGETVIIENDTEVVLRINFWNEYILSNGMKLSGCYFEKQK